MDMAVGAGDLGDLLEARRRIIAAFEEIAAGAEALASRAAEAEDVERLRADLEKERAVNAQLQEQVRVLRDRGTGNEALEAQIAELRAEISNLTAARNAQRVELDAILAQLIPLIEEAS
jgi:septal ring factor EnvC (AmiA/AmiB activator)